MANYQLGISQKAPYSVAGLVPLAATDVLSLVASDPNAVSIVPDAVSTSSDPLSLGTGFIVASNVTASVTVTATLTTAAGLSGSSEVVIDVVPDAVAPTITIMLGPAVAK